MTTLSTIIYDALRETNLVGEGENPTGDAQNEALRRLQTIIYSVLGNEAGEELQPVHVPSPEGLYTEEWYDYRRPRVNTRLVCNLTQAVEIVLPSRPRDGSRLGVQDISGNLSTYNLTLNANGYNIEGGPTLVLSTDDLNREWFFRADLGEWVRWTDLGVGDDMPFPQKFDDLFVTMLAMRMNPRNGVSTMPETVEALRRARVQLRAQYRQHSNPPLERALSDIYPGYRQSDFYGGGYDYPTGD